MIGLGRMGNGMTERLTEGGHEIKTYDPKVPSTAGSLEELAQQLEKPRAAWMMIPAGKITEDTFQDLLGILDEGDTIVDGGNSNFHDSKRRYQQAQEKGINFVDVGVSGGIWGLEVGFCLMAGGDDEPVRRLEPILETLAPEDGYAHVGPSGAGHFVKMVHNGIEYGLMQSYAEGFELMDHCEYELDLYQISGHLALRLRRPQLVTRAAPLGLSSSMARSSTTSRPTSRTRVRAAGRWTRRSR
jgi:6-phosphogluconate dehydrogenase